MVGATTKKTKTRYGNKIYHGYMLCISYDRFMRFHPLLTAKWQRGGIITVPSRFIRPITGHAAWSSPFPPSPPPNWRQKAANNQSITLSSQSLPSQVPPDPLLGCSDNRKREGLALNTYNHRAQVSYPRRRQQKQSITFLTVSKQDVQHSTTGRACQSSKPKHTNSRTTHTFIIRNSGAPPPPSPHRLLTLIDPSTTLPLTHPPP